MNRTKTMFLTAVLTIAALAVGQSAWAVGTFTVNASYDSSTNQTTFTITRTGDTSATETVYYRTVSLSAIAGQHFTAQSGNLTFDADHNERSVKITESTPSGTGADAYFYQTSTTRSYRFEVLDINGFQLAYKDRSISRDLISVPSSGAFNEKELTVSINGDLPFTDRGYAGNAFGTAKSSSFFSATNIAPKAYYTMIGAQLHMTLSMYVREQNNGYQYVQILVDKSQCDNRDDCSNGDPGNIHLSRYMAGFDHEPSSTNTTWAKYTFPVTSCGNNCNEVSGAWSNGVTNKLYTQKFNTNCRATDGKLILPWDFTTLVVRFNASGGGTDNDEWHAKDITAHFQAVDGTAPTLFNNSTSGITVSDGPYVKGNTFYVSVPFSEIVTVSGTPTLINNWGTLSYSSGSGSNVLTFKGTIANNIGSALSVSGFSGTVKDLAGKSFAWSSAPKTFSATSTATYSLTATNTVLSGLESQYVVSSAAIEPHPTVTFYKGKMTESNRVTLAETTDYTLAWTGNTAAGTGTVTASGTGSYTGSVSTTFPLRWATYTVRFNSNGGSGTMDDMAFTYETAQNLTVNAFNAPTGFRFYRWATETDGSGSTFTNSQEVNNLTAIDGTVVDLYAQWEPLPMAGSGTVDAPWLVQYPSQLNYIASMIKNNSFWSTGKYFKQIADLVYEGENNFTPVGNGGSTQQFNGTYDGNNKIIRGIHCLSTGDYVGLFGGIASSGVVKNIVLDCVSFTGSYLVGGIAGWNGGIVENCLVINSTITATTNPNNNYYRGAIAGKNTGTLTANYYRDTSVNGIITSVGCASSDCDGARSVHTLSLGTNITASGESVAISGTTYYAAGTTITLGYNSSVTQRIIYHYNDGMNHDLTGNTFTLPADDDVTVSVTFADIWSGNGTSGSPYLITTTDQLDLLAKMVNGTDGYKSNSFSGKFFKLGNNITYSHTTDWNSAASTENNFTSIGGYFNENKMYFSGTFDGNGKTVSGIRIYKEGTLSSDQYQGLFGDMRGTVKNVTLADARITGYLYTGGIVGYNRATIENCHVAADVAIHSIQAQGKYHGGIAGVVKGNSSKKAKVSGCTSTATLTSAASADVSTATGGIVGDLNSYGIVENCLAFRATVNGGNKSGAIVGRLGDTSFTLTANHYYGCTVNGTAAIINVGIGTESGNASPHDGAGARSVHTITLGTDIAATATATVSHGGTDYYAAGTTVTLSYGGSVPVGYQATFSYNDGTSHAVTGNTFEMPAANVTVNATIEVIPWSGSGDSENDPYLILYSSQLDLLAKMVNGTDGYTANSFYGKFFKLGADITYTHTTAWNAAASTENNFTAIGMSQGQSFCGTFDGDGHTISGIRIYKGEDNEAGNNQGLFGYVKGGTVKNVTVSDARITGRRYVGGIAGYLFYYDDTHLGSIENCHATATVAIHSVVSSYADYHGGIVGGTSSTVSGCTSSASLTIADGLTGCEYYGGIVGRIDGGTIKNCLALGVTIPSVSGFGAIAGYNYRDRGTLTANYYRDCTVGDKTSDMGCNESDIAGARGVYALTLGSGISITAAGESVVFSGTSYYASNSTVTFSYGGTLPAHYNLQGFDATAGTFSGNTLTMPHQDVTVTPVILPDYAYFWGDGNDGSETKPYVITTVAGLDGLAYEVNRGNNFSGVYFKLGNDIAYDPATLTIDNDGDGVAESNYTAIGVSGKTFSGIFDGDGKTVSGIRLYKPDADGQGLFGRISNGTVKNVTLADAHITGLSNAGGIAGINDGTLAHCLALGVSVSGTDGVGAIVGYSGNNDLTANYYRGCTVDGVANAVNVGVGYEKNGTVSVNASAHDVDGARSIHVLTLGDQITAAGESVVIGGVTYFAGNTSVTLAYSGELPVGYQMNYSYNDGTAHAVAGNTFTMPATDAAVTGSSDVQDYALGHAGTDADPYIIYNRSQLDLFATRVNAGMDDREKFIKLGADIAYDYTTAWDAAVSTENNFTAIGTSSSPFIGTFDGDGHTISGLRIYKEADDETSDMQGLFGYVNYGTIKNVTVSDARITGRSYVGGVAGFIVVGTVDNCRVSDAAIHAVVNSASYHSALVGYNSKSTVSNCLVFGASLTNAGKYAGVITGSSVQGGTLSKNYYRNCSVDGKASNIGVGISSSSVGYTSQDRNGARGLVLITIGENVEITDASEPVVIDGVTYYAYNTSFTLSYTGGNVPEGSVIDYFFNGSSISSSSSSRHATVDGTVTAVFTDLWGIAGGADGSEAHPYVITTTEGLDYLLNQVDDGNGYEGKYFVLGSDISFSYIIQWNDADVVPNSSNFSFIGTVEHPFKGSFDGQGHTVSGIRSFGPFSDNAGLFGYIQNATVKNITLTDSRFTYRTNAGGIVGYNDGGTVANCHVSGTVAIHNVYSSDSRHHGGIVGYNAGGVIDGCSSAVTLSLADDLTGCTGYGGIVGYTDGGTVSNCLAFGATIGGNANQGAVIGTVGSAVTATANYYRGCTVAGVANATDVGCDGSDCDGVSGLYTLTLGQDISAAATAFSYGGSDYYPAGTSVTLSYGGNVPDEYQAVFSYNDGTTHEVSGNTFAMPSADVTVSAAVEVTPWSGSGDSADDPYVIMTRSQLDLLAARVNDRTAKGYSSTGFSGKFFRLGADIAYDAVSAWDDYRSTEDNFTVIGTSQYYCFRGTFDGDGHTISGLRINKEADEEASNIQGLFGYVNGGTVKNVTVTNCRFTGRNYVAAIVAFLLNGTVDNCQVIQSAVHNVLANASKHGGIVGYMSNSTVSNCLAVMITVSNASSNIGALVAFQSGTNTLTANYYYYCLVNGILSATGVGCNGSDCDGARSLHEIATEGDVRITGAAESVVIDGTTLYAAGTEVTLGYGASLPEGILFKGYKYEDHGSAHEFSGNTFTMPSCDVKASIMVAPDADTYWGGGTGTATDPYVITTVAGLNLMSAACTLMNFPAGTYFQLGADIAYDPDALTIDNDGDGVAESNFTPICANRPFYACFDGQGHTISGIRCSYPSGAALFGLLFGDETCVRNVVVSDAVFSGANTVGVIVANAAKGFVANCHVLASSVTASAGNVAGAVIGSLLQGQASNNYYYGCSITAVGTTSTTNIGIGQCIMGDRPPVVGDVESRTFNGISYTDCAVEGLALYDDDSAQPAGSQNADVIAGNLGTGKNVMLYGRTLWKDGYWNTLSLPFNVPTLADSPLAGATVMELDVTGTYDGHQTGLGTDGTLYLYFKTATAIQAGTPYLIKWDDAADLLSPFFAGMEVTDAADEVVSGDGKVQFKGTYGNLSFTDADESILLMGAGNTLCWPESGARIGACRAYFHVGGGSHSVRAFVLGFDGTTTGMASPYPSSEGKGTASPFLPDGTEEVFDLAGRRLESAPKERGVYIVNGRKVLVK